MSKNDSIPNPIDPLDPSQWVHAIQGNPPPPLSASYSSAPPTSWTTNQTQSYAITVTNTGSQTWNATGANNVRLGVHFGDDSDGWGPWATDQRFELPGDVAPGGSVTFTNVSVTAPTTVGSYVLRHRMVKEGIAWFDQIQKTNVTVTAAPPLSASYSSTPPTVWCPGQTQSYSITVTNTGSATWNATGSNNVRLGVHFGTDNDGWGPWATDQRFALPGDVAPGGSVTFTNVSVTAPTAAGSYVLRHRMVKEGIAWFDQIQKTNVTVGGSGLSASYSSAPPTSWTTNQTQSYTITVTNNGCETWNATGSNNVRLGVHFGDDSDGWGPWATDQRFALPGDVAPGGSVTFTNVSITAPTAAGSYVLRHRMVKEGIAWFDQIQKTNVTVN